MGGQLKFFLSFEFFLERLAGVDQRGNNYPGSSNPYRSYYFELPHQDV